MWNVKQVSSSLSQVKHFVKIVLTVVTRQNLERMHVAYAVRVNTLLSPPRYLRAESARSVSTKTSPEAPHAVCVSLESTKTQLVNLFVQTV